MKTRQIAENVISKMNIAPNVAKSNIKLEQDKQKELRLKKAKEEKDKFDLLLLKTYVDNLYLLDDVKKKGIMPKSKDELKSLKSLYDKKKTVKEQREYEASLNPEELKLYYQQRLRENKILYDEQEARKQEQSKVEQERTEAKIDREESKIDRTESKIDRTESKAERDRIARKEQQERDDKQDQYYVDTHQIYKVKNTKLRDALDRQYKKMFNDMITNPRKYGNVFNGRTTIKPSSQETIDIVFKNYGKPDKTLDTIINDGLIDIASKAVGYIPVVGKYAKQGVDAAIDLTKDEPVGTVPLDYNEFEGQGINKNKNIIIMKNNYLEMIKKIASKNGYDINKLEISDKPKYKFKYDNVYFGSSNNKDYIYYLLMDGLDLATKKRYSYLKRSEKIRGNWKDNIKSPNNLSRLIIWDSNNKLNL